jgi:two-component system sensor histidine kinase KdpD
LRRELIENAYEEADRLNRLVGNLLDMTRLEAGAVHLKREPCDLQDVVGAALRQLGRRLEAHQIVTDLPPGLPDFNVDFVLITQVLVNLIDNAIKYAPAGSAITISATAEQNTMVITVIDQGPGVPEEAIGSIFDKLYRVKRANDIGGTGLGLSICQGIVDAHGGQITARNRLEGGLEILVQLPLTANPLF